MTTRELILEAWERDGARSDLEPFPTTATGTDLADIADCYGTRYWLRNITAGQRVIAGSNIRGRALVFPGLVKESFVQIGPTTLSDFDRDALSFAYVAGLSAESFQGNIFYWNGSKSVTGTIGAFDTDRIDIPSLGLSDNSVLVGLNVTIDGTAYEIGSVSGSSTLTLVLDDDVTGYSVGEAVTGVIGFAELSRFILSATDTGTEWTVVLSEALGTEIPDTFDAELRPNGVLLSELGLTTGYRTILKVTDLDNATKLDKGQRKESFFLDPETSVGTPTTWEQRGGRLYFDLALDDTINYRFELLTVPSEAALDVDLFLPEPWHEVILAYVGWKSCIRAQESDRAYAMKRDFQELLVTVNDEAYAEFLRDDDYGVYVQYSEEEI